jgi:DNA-binding MarR family transcriptional regulator
MGKLQPDRPEDNLGWLLATVSHAYTTALTAQLDEIHVSPRAHCLLATALQGEYTQTALAQAIGLDKTTMVVTLDALERAGLVERRMSSTDRRARVVAVTEAGRRKVAEGEAIVARGQDHVLASLPEELRAPFLAALRQLAAGVAGSPVDLPPVRRRAPKHAAVA